jgi:hypothetical protein
MRRIHRRERKERREGTEERREIEQKDILFKILIILK